MMVIQYHFDVLVLLKWNCDDDSIVAIRELVFPATYGVLISMSCPWKGGRNVTNVRDAMKKMYAR